MIRYKGRERRRYKRRGATIALNIIRCGRKKTLPKLDEEVGRNISESGILLECSKRISKGKSITLKIMLSHNHKFRIIQTAAKVKWCKESFRDTYYSGCQFMRMKPADRRAIKKFVNE